MPLPKKISESKSEPTTLHHGDTWSKHGSKCPTSTHRKGYHEGPATSRVTVTVTWSTGLKTRSYIDHVVCKYCGHTWDQEWMPAGF